MKILACLDGSKHSREALDYAVNLGTGGGYEKGYHRLKLCHVAAPKDVGMLSKFKRSAIDDDANSNFLVEAQDVIDDHKSMCKSLDEVSDEDVPLTASSARKIGEKLVEYIEQNGIEVVVVGARGEGEKDRKGASNLTGKLLSRLPQISGGSSGSSEERAAGTGRLGSVARYLIKRRPTDVKIFVVEFGSDIVEKFPKTAVDERAIRRMTKAAVRHGLSQEDAEKIVHLFLKYDADHSGCLDSRELNELLLDFGDDPEEEYVTDAILQVDDDHSGTIEFPEFLIFLDELGDDPRRSKRRGFTEDANADQLKRSSSKSKLTSMLSSLKLKK